MNEPPFIHEARVLAKYLTGRAASPRVVLLYTEALEKMPMEEDPRQQHTWQWCMRHPWALKYIDAGLAWPQRYHALRKRIYIMLAILETQALYSDCFMPRYRKRGYMTVILFRLMRAIANMIAGKILLWFI